MSYFIFNGCNSNDLDIIITKPIVRPTWAPEVEFTPIAGRPRQSPRFKSYYPNKSFTVSAVMADASPEKVQEIYNALRGYGVLSISTAPQELLNVYVDKCDPEGVALMMAEFPITFIAEPFAYAVNKKIVDITNTYLRVENEGTVFCDPIITFTPDSTTTEISCNGKAITVITPTEIVGAGYPADYSITLDCEGELAYYTRPGGDRVACTECTRGPFPRLHEADNYISHSGVRSAALEMRERWY